MSGLLTGPLFCGKIHSIIQEILNDKIHMNKQRDPNDIAEVFVISDLETLKAVSTPFRQKLMQLMAEEARTVKEMARELDMPPSRLYYHVNQLEQHGIIRVVETRMVSGIMEKRYRLAARGFHVDRKLLAARGEQDPVLEVLLESTLGAGEKEILRGVQEGVIDLRIPTSEPKAIYLAHALAYLTPDQYQAFQQRLQELLEEFETLPQKPADDASILTGLLVAIYPTAPQTE